MVDTPTKVPNELTAGDSWSWLMSFDDYPASTWTVTFYFRGPKKFEVVASASGDDHLAEITAASSADYPPGLYTWLARAVNGTAMYTVGTGYARVAPNLADAAVDHRSFNQRALEALEAVIENRASTDQMSMSIGGRSISRMSWDEILKAYDQFKARVAAELGDRPGALFVRFSAP